MRFHVLLLTLFLLLSAVRPASGAKIAIQWQRWEESLTTATSYPNPYADVTVSVTYSGPGGQTLSTYGFWDGGNVFKIRCAFPTAGAWTWSTTCSDAANTGLHHQSGAVTVSAYAGANPLYLHGLPKVSANQRYLTYGDGTPFIWMGDTAWIAPLRATQADWQSYIRDRVAKKFSVVQISPASNWGGTTDASGNTPFTGTGIGQWTPAYWQGFEQKVEYANQQGVLVFSNGLMEPVARYPSEADARLFARNLAARLYGNFVVFSPSFDSPFLALGNQVGQELDGATSAHLLTQHTGTSLTAAQAYYDETYLDFSGCQSGHNNGNRDVTTSNAIHWNLALYNRTPHKPVINLEAYYDANGTTAGLGAAYLGTAKDARSLGYLSWLSGALGYTYGAYGLWNWETDSSKDFYWQKALSYPSAVQMGYLHDFFASIAWWRLEPAHALIQNQSAQNITKMVLGKSAAGDLGVAYLPDNAAIQIDMSAFAQPMIAKWFDPVNNTYTAIAGTVANSGTKTFTRPAASGDFVLLLTTGTGARPIP